MEAAIELHQFAEMRFATGLDLVGAVTEKRVAFSKRLD
jgi:hypothetical protein